jgi:SAM-dependent methyltransferase
MAIADIPRALKLSDFELDAASGVRVLGGAERVTSYRDGAEEYLFEALGSISDRSVGSPDVARLIHDWASLYHLSPYRSTLFDCLGLESLAGSRVLELGAGMGAMSRWLGEHGAELHSIEGSLARAEVARRRTEDLDNVQLYAGNYSDLAEDGTFDVVTLIGVLEYSHLYHPVHGDDPAAAATANLSLAARALGDRGVLVLAIENRLGMKYLNGAREDHSGRTFEGVQGYPWSGTAVTWSHRELTQLLSDAGFGHVETLVPYPDYKLARGVINPSRCDDEDRIYNWLANPAPDRGPNRRPTLYNESLAVREFVRAGLLTDLANSHLVLAFRGDPAESAEELGIELDWTARHYSLDRRPGLRKRITLADGVVESSSAPLGETREVIAQAREAMKAFGLASTPTAEPQARGDLVSLSVLEAVTAEGIGPRFTAHVRRYREWLIAEFGTGGGTEACPLVDGAAFDATWWNVVADPDTGEWTMIDREWRLELPVPADYVVWRMLRYFFAGNLIQLPRKVSGLRLSDLVRQGLDAAGGTVSGDAITVFEATERAVLGAIAPGPLPEGRSSELEALARLAEAPRTFSVVAFAAEVIAEPALLAAYAEQFDCDDAATLVLYAPDADEAEVADGVTRSLELAGIGDDAPDMMLLAVPGGPDAEAALVADASALLSDGEVPEALSLLPRVGRDDVRELRPYAEAVWASA